METFAGMVEQMDENIDKGALYGAQPALLGNSIFDIIKRYYDKNLEGTGECNSFVWYSPRWAQSLYKMYSTEGGIKVPMILEYPTWTVFRGREVEEMRRKSWVKFFENDHRKGDMTTAILSHDDPAVHWELLERMTPLSYGKDPGETKDTLK
ncbi:hypothetical protein C8R42DRAFT_694084 [Lentinula raphanica]|nr:hypothetical protein C8R42DRAFT_694084 [Lentinula raphanica]